MANVRFQMPAPWSVYEDAARRVLADIRHLLNVSDVGGKQSLPGSSGTSWEIDAKAGLDGQDGFLVVEVRRHTTSGLKQEAIAAVAYRIQDVGGAGGIVVSPLPLQLGAKLVAKDAGIQHVLLTPESTTESYLAEFLGRRFIGETVKEKVYPSDSCDAQVVRKPTDAT